MTQKYTEDDFPPVGTVLQMPLADGRFGICKVLQVTSEDGEAMAMVAASSWLGDVTPNLDSAAIRDTLIVTHHSWNGSPSRVWVSEPPPQCFVPKKINQQILTDIQGGSLSLLMCSTNGDGIMTEKT